MNISRKLIRIWLTISSVIGFVAGWIFLSHTVEAKTVIQLGNTTIEMPAIPAVPTLSSAGSNSVQTFSINPNQPQQSFAPSFRTGGS
jgi:hypothetical protein